MYSFVNLLLRHLLFALLFISAIIAASATCLSFYLAEKNAQTDIQLKEFVTVISASTKTAKPSSSTATDYTLADPSTAYNNSYASKTIEHELIQLLPKAIAFTRLSLQSQTQVLNYVASNADIAARNSAIKSQLPSFLLDNLSSLYNQHFPAKEGITRIEHNNIVLTYQLDNSHELKLLSAFSIVVTLATVLMALMSFTSTLVGRSFKNRTLDKLISAAIGNIGGTVDKNTKQKHKLINSAFPKTSEVLQSLEAQFNTTATETSALETQAYFDSVTKLENRNRFVQFYTEQINNGKGIEFGMLIIIRANALNKINQSSGYHEGDKYICKMAEIIKKQLMPLSDAKVFRLNSSDFAVILPNVKQKSAEDLAQKLTVSFNEYQQGTELDAVAYSGITAFTKEHPLGELLALSDTSISIAQTKQGNAWHCQSEEELLAGGSANLGNLNWREEITYVVENQGVKLLAQPIKPCSKNKRVYSEILSRFVSKSGELLPTASFFAMAEKLDKIVQVDRMIIEKTIEQIVHKSLQDHYFGINISAQTLQDQQFIIWLERRLLRDPGVAAKLIFEMSEKGLQQNIENSKQFIDMIHRVGARVTVERFGVGLTSFKLFRDLKPDFIKMDSSYTRDIDEDKNNQHFLRLMIDLAHRLSITVLAESVENQNERFMLEKLFVDGTQGFYIGKPEAL